MNGERVSFWERGKVNYLLPFPISLYPFPKDIYLANDRLDSQFS